MKVIEGHYYHKAGKNWVESEYSENRNDALNYVDGELILDSVYYDWMYELTNALLDAMSSKYMTKGHWVNKIVRTPHYNGTCDYTVYTGEGKYKYKYVFTIKG